MSQASRVSRAPNDKEHLPPTFQEIAPTIQWVSEVLIDSGFVSETAVDAIEQTPAGQSTGVRVLAAVGRIRHGRTVAELEQRADPPAPLPEATQRPQPTARRPRPLLLDRWKSAQRIGLCHKRTSSAHSENICFPDIIRLTNNPGWPNIGCDQRLYRP